MNFFKRFVISLIIVSAFFIFMGCGNSQENSLKTGTYKFTSVIDIYTNEPVYKFDEDYLTITVQKNAINIIRKNESTHSFTYTVQNGEVINMSENYVIFTIIGKNKFTYTVNIGESDYTFTFEHQ